MSAKKRLISPRKSSNKLFDCKKQKLSFGDTADATDCIAAFFEDDCFDFVDAVVGAVRDESKLDLSIWQRCCVQQVERLQRTFDLVLYVYTETKDNKENSKGKLFGKCHLQGPWAHTKLAAGEIVSLKAIWDEQLSAYKVDKDNGFCITNPDQLLSGTTVVGSLFCQRKAVLQDRFRGIDANSKVMVIGSLVHELLQLTLAKGLSTYEEIDVAARNLLESPNTAYMLYSSLLTYEETASEVKTFVPNIVTFVREYVQGKTIANKPVHPEQFQGIITSIADIEENLWVPRLGLKGKIDVSVHINRKGGSKLKLDTRKYPVPLELKTGRASFSMEHKGQLILYQMMLNAIGRDMSSSGLLLYIREGIMREVCSGRNEQRDLIALRNELCYYLTRFTTSARNKDGKLCPPFELPDPISHHSACSNCAYATICCTFARTDAQLNLHESHPLNKVMECVTNHLRSQDIEYFMHWCKILALEEQHDRQSNFQRALWTETPETRQRQGRAILNLHLNGNVLHEESRFIHTLKVEDQNENTDLTLSGFSPGEYVIISSLQRLAIAAGVLQTITTSTLTVSLERNLWQNYADEVFIVDKHESQSNMVFNYTNLGLLLDKTERSAILRNIVIDIKPPNYKKTLPKIIATKGKEVLEKLNSLQRSAVLKALTTESYTLIKGLPGTGKTQTLVAIVRLLCLLGKSVIITSHTHSAVDNLLIRLKPYDLPILRLGSSMRVHPELQCYSEETILKNCNTEKELKEKYGTYNVIGVTCLGSSHSIFLHRRFDYCIVDEATQVMQPNVLRPLYFCTKFVLVGDPDQLPPIIRSKQARVQGAETTLFQRLDSIEATSVLSLQYRMNRTITKLANELTYAGALKCGSTDVELATLTLPGNFNSDLHSQPKWLQRVLHSHIDQSIVLLDTAKCSRRSLEFASSQYSKSGVETQQDGHTKYINYCEAAIVMHIIKILLMKGYDPTRIGIIAPYRVQVELFKKLTKEYQQYFGKETGLCKFTAVEVNTVDQYQGRDKDVIIYSGTKTEAEAENIDPVREIEILEDKRRLTVAITRAKKKLILVADASSLERYTPFQNLFKYISKLCKVRLEEGKLEFQWQPLFDEMSQIIS